MEYINNQIPGRGARLFVPCKRLVFYIVTAILFAVPSGVWAVAQEAGVEESLSASPLLGKIQELPVFKGNPSDRTRFDWLLEPEKSRAGVFRTSDGKSVIIANGMVSRRFRIFPNLATTDFTNRMLGESMLRAVSPEGYVWIDGEKWSIGGLDGQPERGYLRDGWIDSMRTVPCSFKVEDFEVRDTVPVLEWKRSRWALNKENPTGKEVVFTLRGSGETEGLFVRLYYSIYDNVPVIRKCMELVNRSGRPVGIDRFSLEYLSFAEPESPSGGDPATFLLPNIHVESDYACKGSFTEKETDITEYWITDSLYTSQRNWPLQTPCILEVKPPIDPAQTLADGETFSTFSVYEMPLDSYDRERKGLFLRRFYRTVAPWTTENPIFLHLTSSDPGTVREAVDQCAETGYEMIILSFGSGADAEDTSAANIAKFKELVDYASAKASRWAATLCWQAGG